MLVVLVQLALAGGGAMACAEHPAAVGSGMDMTAASMASMNASADMSGAPSHAGDTHDGGCPDSGMPDDECRAMSACTSMVAIVVVASATAMSDSHSGALRSAQLVPRSFALVPESPPPRA